jgi:hypothetical protein
VRKSVTEGTGQICVIFTSCENVIFIRNAGTNPKVMAVRSKVNVNRKNLIMSLADRCFEFLRDLEKEHDPDLVRRRAAELPKTCATTVD